MTWARFKEMVERNGVKDDMEIDSIRYEGERELEAVIERGKPVAIEGTNGPLVMKV